MMEAYLMVVPNPVVGDGSKGLIKNPNEGESQTAMFLVYSNTENNAKDAFRKYLNIKWLPDGTSVVRVANDNKIRKECVKDLRDVCNEAVSELSDAEKAVAFLQGKNIQATIILNDIGEEVVLMWVPDVNICVELSADEVQTRAKMHDGTLVGQETHVLIKNFQDEQA